MIRLTLPVCPSANRWHRTVNGRPILSSDDTALLIALRRKAPEDHLLEEFSAGERDGRVDFICSSPMVIAHYETGSDYGLADTPYPTEKAS